jgi:hypothetical protein
MIRRLLAIAILTALLVVLIATAAHAAGYWGGV